MIETVFEDKDWRRPIFALVRDGLVFVGLPTLCFVLLSWGDEPISRAWVVVLLGWNIGAIVEGLLRCRAIAAADSVSRVEVRLEQVTSRVVRVELRVTAFRRIKRVSIGVLCNSGLVARQGDRRVLPSAGRRWVSAVVCLSVPDRERCGASAELVLRLVTVVEGCPDFVNEVVIPWPRVVADQGRLAGDRARARGWAT